jgi:RNA-directed DNA polymerase
MGSAVCRRSDPIGYFHIDIAEVQTAEGKLYLFVAIDRTSKFAYAELHAKAGKMGAAQFLRNLIAATPYAIHTVLTDNVLCGEAAAALGQQISARRLA